MDALTLWMAVGFLLAGYSVIANYSVEIGECSDWGHAYETAWCFIELYVENQNND